MKNKLVNVIICCINNNQSIKESIGDIEYSANTLLTLSSIDFADLLIDIEDYLNIPFIEKISLESKITIIELAERIEKIV